MNGAATALSFFSAGPLVHSGSWAVQKPAFLPQWRRTSKRKCLQRSQCGLITAQFELKPPPYPLNSLEPHMSRQTLEYHWGRHQRGYVENLNKQIVGTELDGLTLENVIIASYNKGDPLPVFNNAAQVWNHDFFWGSMKPGGGGLPSGDLLELIGRDFGSYEVFLQVLLSTASSQFGSGWAWLVYKANRLNVENAVNPCPSETDNKLMVVRSPNAVNPLVWDYSPLLAIDVWEHAYYLDYENRKADYVTMFVEKLVSWETVSSRLEMAKARAAERTREEEERRRQEDDEETEDNKPMEMYLDSDSDESEVE